LPLAQPLQLKASDAAYERARQLVPGGILGIRRPYNFVPGEYPIFFESGRGGRVTDVDGNSYIDMLCAYGPIIIGHREREIDDAVIAQIRDKGFCFALTQRYQNTLAEKLRELIPAAEKSVFVKTGSDATLAAIRIARAFTGRSKIARCGYHGWHDWCCEIPGGIPPKNQEDTFAFSYNDLDQLRDIFREADSQVAAVIMTPIGHTLAEKVQEPAPGFLEGARMLCEQHGAVLVFDEIRSGFRVSLGGAGARYGVVPDLACFGKAMANGYAISAVVGRAEVMAVVEKDAFVSSTFFPNSLAQVAALKTIELLERDRMLDRIDEKGREFLRNLDRIVGASGIPAEVSQVPSMPFITFTKDPEKRYKTLRTRFYTHLIRRGVFLQPYHHGYIAFRHDDADLRQVETVIEEALGELTRIA